MQDRQPIKTDIIQTLTLTAFGIAAVLLWRVSTMSEDQFLAIMGIIEQSCGGVLAVIDMFGGVWRAGAVFGVVALAANLSDFLVTMHLSPDLTLEANPIWNTIIRIAGLEFAILFGFTGKILLSIIAAQCMMFYAANVHVLFPRRPQPFIKFLQHLGETNQDLRKRLKAFAVVFAFYFAAMNLFCFYIAYANSLVNDLPAISRLPALPAVVCISLALATIAFAAVTFLLHRSKTV
jgi:hypothetical protein